jgi:hypothetical protein
MKTSFEVHSALYGTLKEAIKAAKQYDFMHIYSSGDLIAVVAKLHQHGYDVNVLPHYLTKD